MIATMKLRAFELGGKKWAVCYVGQLGYIKVGPTVEACHETIMLENYAALQRGGESSTNVERVGIRRYTYDLC